MSRTNSLVSELSSEMMSSEGSVRDSRSRQSSHVRENGGDEVGGSDDEDRDDEQRDHPGDVRCPNCGGTTFKATMGEAGHRLRCRSCGTVL